MPLWIMAPRKLPHQYHSENRSDVIRCFSTIPKRVMDGSEPGEVVAAAVLSGAPVELQARTVRYAPTQQERERDRVKQSLIQVQDISTRQDSYTIGGLAWSSLANGLGRSTKGPSMGESTDGLAVISRHDARDTLEFQVERRCHTIRSETRL